jgi:hypothetical protein
MKTENLIKRVFDLEKLKTLDLPNQDPDYYSGLIFDSSYGDYDNRIAAILFGGFSRAEEIEEKHPKMYSRLIDGITDELIDQFSSLGFKHISLTYGDSGLMIGHDNMHDDTDYCTCSKCKTNKRKGVTQK